MSKKSFERYEHILKEVVDIFPRPLQVVPSLLGLAPTTFSARFRDAKLSLATYQWETTINMARFMQIESEIETSHQGDFVIIGSAETVKPTKQSGSSWPPGFIKQLNTLDARDAGAIHVHCASEEIIKAVALTIHNKIASGPYEFIDHTASADFILGLETLYDIAVDIKSPTHFLML